MMYEVAEILQALRDERVVNALALALRDQHIRTRFRSLRTEMRVLEACEAPTEHFCLSPERIKSIVYRPRGKERLKEFPGTMSADNNQLANNTL